MTLLTVDRRILENYRMENGKLEKRCTGCANWYDRSCFHKRSRSSDGLQSWCKVCTNQARNANRETYDERIERETKQLAGLAVVNKLRTESAFRRLAHRLYVARVGYIVSHPKDTFCQVELRMPQTLGGYTFTDIDTLAEYIEKANQ